ncbi:MAG: potassium-transporting ATPase subunit C, partial [Hyphomicrobiales bacterium]|nr:potassium-transporting ATPase subunit C [Hyphomicrobiales bacterium]
MKEHLRPAVVSLLAFTVLLGIIYPFAMDGVAAVAFPHQATGSLIHDKAGHVAGSELIGQPFDDPGYF